MSFRSASGGRQLGGIKVALTHECKSFPPQVDPDAEPTSQPAGGGQVTVTLAKPRTGNRPTPASRCSAPPVPRPSRQIFFTTHYAVPPDPASGRLSMRSCFRCRRRPIWP